MTLSSMTFSMKMIRRPRSISKAKIVSTTDDKEWWSGNVFNWASQTLALIRGLVQAGYMMVGKIQFMHQYKEVWLT